MELRGSLVLNHFPFLSSHEVQNKVEEEVFSVTLKILYRFLGIP
jgi:hypothetical protein